MTLVGDSYRWMAPIFVAAFAALIGMMAGLNPQLAMGASLALGFVLLTLANLTAGLVVFTFLSFIALVPSAGGSALSFLKIAGLLLALSWLSVKARRGETSTNFVTEYPGLAWTVLGFLAWVALSQVWAENPAATFTDLTRYALNLVLFLIVFTAIRDRRGVTELMVAFVAGAAIAALYGLVHAAPGDPAEADRLSGTIGNPNELAAVLVVGAALGMGLAAASRRSPVLRLAAMSGAGFCVIAILFTLSRTGIVAMAFALVASIALAGRWRGRAAMVALVVAFIGFGYFTAVASPEARQRVTETGNGTGRLDLWTVGRRMVAAHPINGVGAGNFSTASVHYLLQPGALTRTDFIVDTPKVAHNTYLEIVAETGIIGLSLFLGIILFCLRYGGRAVSNFAARGDYQMEVLSRALLVALVGLLAADFFGSAQFEKALWLLLALIPAVYAISRREQDDSPMPAAPLS